MRVKSASTVLVVTAIIFVMAVASEVFVDDFLHPTTLFSYLVFSTLAAGLLASAVVEKINARMFS